VLSERGLPHIRKHATPHTRCLKRVGHTPTPPRSTRRFALARLAWGLPYADAFAVGASLAPMRCPTVQFFFFVL
jgi:hypothetical protein